VITEFCSCGVPDIELTIQLQTESHRTHLLELARHRRLGKSVSVLYVYSLVDDHLSYPDQNGLVVYIGQALRATGKETTGRRFSQHISKGPTTGSDTGTNFVLSRYYWLGKALNIKVYVIDERYSHTARELEMHLINQHMRQFGAPPLGQGAACAGLTYEARCGIPLIDLLTESRVPSSLVDQPLE
jgi:hypothetical protein